ncbi:MAG: NAD-dependent succinate-semialdehyde dehydrogenase [Alphaproteobacteria bacterium]|nr:MAG: NAD-dependent succinate-semialdehyde dehydrogenase [Alphaproteobacteria bacterium]
MLKTAIGLKRADLLRERALIGDQWVEAEDGGVLEVVNPATGAVIGTVPKLSPAQVEKAIAVAAQAQRSWAALTAKDRSARLRAWYEAIMAHADDLALLMTSEQGKPLAEARGEVVYAASFVEWFAEEAKRVYGETIPAPKPDQRILVLRQPIGVVGAITPWNFPAAMLTRKAAPAIAAGCAVVAKPAEDTPFTALALGQLALEAGIPAGVLNIVTGEPEVVARPMLESETVRMISFTGSTEVGKLLMRASADTVKKVHLELGGNAAFIVFDDADLEAAVEGVLASKYRNTGQTCVCANRIFVQEGIYERFAEAFAERVKALKVGAGTEEGVVQGPLINEQALEKVKRHVADALAKGARLLTGGRPHALGRTFFEPTVIADATPEMLCFREETFGPVAPLFRFRDEEEVVRLANDTPYGLAAYFYSRDVGRVFRVAEALETGIVGVNTGLISTEVAPFGGVKQSGIGREGGHEGIMEFVETKYVCLALP